MSFSRQTDNTQVCLRAVKAWNDVVIVGNDAFTPGDCHGGYNSFISESGLMWFKMTDTVLCRFCPQLLYITRTKTTGRL